MNPVSRPSLARACAITLVAACAATAIAQTVAPKLAAAYEGSWDNLEGPVTNSMRITIDKVEADGSVQGTYARFARYCAAKGIPMKGTFDGSTLVLTPDFGEDKNCKDTRWTFQVQPDGRLSGLGNSYYQLKALLKPVAP
jgi:hypothetical protein